MRQKRRLISGKPEIEDGIQWWIVWYFTNVGAKGRHRDTFGDEQITMIAEAYGGKSCVHGKTLFECTSARVSRLMLQDMLGEGINEWGVIDVG